MHYVLAVKGLESEATGFATQAPCPTAGRRCAVEKAATMESTDGRGKGRGEGS